MAYIYYGQELYHSGILGMKWGIRRYQNEDGSLTEEGKARYARLQKKISKENDRISKYSKKLTNLEKSTAIKVQKQKAKAAKLENKALNGWFISNRRREKLLLKSRRVNAKANYSLSKITNQQAKINKAKARIDKYNRSISKIDPKYQYIGQEYIAVNYFK